LFCPLCDEILPNDEFELLNHLCPNLLEPSKLVECCQCKGKFSIELIDNHTVHCLFSLDKIEEEEKSMKLIQELKEEDKLEYLK
jgi:hypothetical protein